MPAVQWLVFFTQLGFLFAQEDHIGRSRVLYPSDNEETTEGNPSLPDPSSTFPARQCVTQDGQSGACLQFDHCQTFMTPRPDFESLRQNLCGFRGQVPHVCCPEEALQGMRDVRLVTTTNNLMAVPVAPTFSVRPSNLPEDCGKSNVSFLRIVDGEEAEPGAWPWLAALFIEERGVRSAECGAAVISSHYVVTAAHCVTGNGGQVLSPRQLTVRVGDHHLFSLDDGASPLDIPVGAVIRHAEFHHRTFLNDIALLRLQEEIHFNDFIHPVCLPYDEPIRTEDLQGKKGFVAGWGTTSFDGPSSPVVRQVQLPVWNHTDCRDAYRDDLNLTEVYLCAGLADGGKDACQGDSGGPLTIPVRPNSRFYLIGIVSFGKRCAQPGFPGVYTNVRNFLPWIAENVL